MFWFIRNIFLFVCLCPTFYYGGGNPFVHICAVLAIVQLFARLVQYERNFAQFMSGIQMETFFCVKSPLEFTFPQSPKLGLQKLICEMGNNFAPFLRMPWAHSHGCFVIYLSILSAWAAFNHVQQNMNISNDLWSVTAWKWVEGIVVHSVSLTLSLFTRTTKQSTNRGAMRLRNALFHFNPCP